MELPKYGPGLIRTRRAAIIALCLSGYFAAQDVWISSTPPRGRVHWLMFDDPLDSGLPIWAVAAINLVFWAGAIWCCIGLYRASQGKERIVIAGWAPGLLGFIKPLFPGDLGVPLRYAEAGGMIAAVIAAAYLVFERPPKPHSANRTSKTTTAIILVAALLLGILIALTESRSGWPFDGVSMGALALGAAAFSLINRSRPWLWALGLYASIPAFYAVTPPHNPWVPSEPLPFGLNNRVGQSVFATIAFLLLALAGAYAGVLIRKLLDKKIRTTNPSSAN